MESFKYSGVCYQIINIWHTFVFSVIKYSPWSKCSAPCGEGNKTRNVVCTVNNENVDNSECQLQTNMETVGCMIKRCPGNYLCQ